MAVKWLFMLSMGYKYPLENQGYCLSNSEKKVPLLADAEVQERARGGCAEARMGGEGQSRTDTPHAHLLPDSLELAPDPEASWNVYMDAPEVTQKIPNSITLDPRANA